MPQRLLTPINEVRVFKCESWDEFIAKVRMPHPFVTEQGDETGSLTLFRGHADPNWELMSALDRVLLSEGVKKEGEKVIRRERAHIRTNRGADAFERYCKCILEKFRTAAHGMVGTYPGIPDDELWALGRHHGLLTPLLDWSESPYVAAFFALGQEAKKWERGAKVRVWPVPGAVHVWGLRFYQNLEVKGEFEVVPQVPLGAHRQRAQRGVFTKLLSLRHVEILGYLKERGLAHCLEVYEIPLNDGARALRDLELMNITPATLFPDLTGAAMQANMDYEGVLNTNYFREYFWTTTDEDLDP